MQYNRRETLEKLTMEIKIDASPNGGSIIKTSRNYIPKQNCEVDAEKVKADGDKATALMLNSRIATEL